MYYNGCKYDRCATAEEVKFLLDVIEKQDRREEYRRLPGQAIIRGPGKKK
jgi:hypothetical protein